jgi:hypothetical protein
MDLITESDYIRKNNVPTDSSAKTDIYSAYNERALDRDYKEMDESATSQASYDRTRRNRSDFSVGGYSSNNSNRNTSNKNDKTILSNRNTSNINTNTYSDMTNTYDNFGSNDRKTVSTGTTNRNNVYSTNRSTDYNTVYSDNLSKATNTVTGGQEPTNSDETTYDSPNDTVYYDGTNTALNKKNKRRGRNSNTMIGGQQTTTQPSSGPDAWYMSNGFPSEKSTNYSSNQSNRYTSDRTNDRNESQKYTPPTNTNMYGGSFNDDLMGSTNTVLDDDKILKKLNDVEKRTNRMMYGGQGKTDSDLSITLSNTPKTSSNKKNRSYKTTSEVTSDYMPSDRYTNSAYGSETSPMNTTDRTKVTSKGRRTKRKNSDEDKSHTQSYTQDGGKSHNDYSNSARYGNSNSYSNDNAKNSNRSSGRNTDASNSISQSNRRSTRKNTDTSNSRSNYKNKSNQYYPSDIDNTEFDSDIFTVNG